MKYIATIAVALFLATSAVAKDKAPTYSEDEIAKYEAAVDVAAIRISQGTDTLAAAKRADVEAVAEKYRRGFHLVEETNPLYRLVSEQYGKLAGSRRVRLHLFRGPSLPGVAIGDDVYLHYDSIHKLATFAGGPNLILATLAHELGHGSADFTRLLVIDGLALPADLKESLRLRLEMRADEEAARLMQVSNLSTDGLTQNLRALDSGTDNDEDGRLKQRIANLEMFAKMPRVASGTQYQR